MKALYLAQREKQKPQSRGKKKKKKVESFYTRYANQQLVERLGPAESLAICSTFGVWRIGEFD